MCFDEVGAKLGSLLFRIIKVFLYLFDIFRPFTDVSPCLIVKVFQLS